MAAYRWAEFKTIVTARNSAKAADGTSENSGCYESQNGSLPFQVLRSQVYNAKERLNK